MKTTTTRSRIAHGYRIGLDAPFTLVHERDCQSFDDLYRRYRPGIRRLATSMGFSAEDADDIVQETMLECFLVSGRLQPYRTMDQLMRSLALKTIRARATAEPRETVLDWARPKAA